jgi:hypothetical protein
VGQEAQEIILKEIEPLRELLFSPMTGLRIGIETGCLTRGKTTTK